MVVFGAVALFSILCNGAGQGVAQGASAAHREGRGAHRAGAVASCGAQTQARKKQNPGPAAVLQMACMAGGRVHRGRHWRGGGAGAQVTACSNPGRCRWRRE
jgi:hypothetical protein